MKTGVLRATVSRADLLLRLQLDPQAQWLGLAMGEGVEGAAWGYQIERAQQNDLPPDDDPPLPPPPSTPSLNTQARLPLRMPYAWQIKLDNSSPKTPELAPEPLQLDASAAPQRPSTSDALTETLRIDRLHAPPAQGARAGRLLAQSSVITRRVDWPATLRLVARGRLPSPLPLQRRRSWTGHVNIVLDARAASMCPYAWDMQGFATQIKANIGLFNTAEHWLPVDAGKQRTASAPLWPGLDRVGETWLVFTDAGMADRAGSRHAAFTDWLAQMAQRQHRVILMTPLPRDSLRSLPGPAWAANWHQSDLHRSGRHGQDAALTAAFEQSAVVQVLSLVHLLGAVSPLMLRGLRGLVAPPDSELEWLVWNHPHIDKNREYCCIKPQHQSQYASCLRQMHADLLDQALRMGQLLQAGLCDADAHLAVLNALALAPALEQRWRLEAARARQFATYWRVQGQTLQDAELSDWETRVLRFLGHASRAVRAENSLAFTALAAQALQSRLARGDEVPSFAGLDPLWSGAALRKPSADQQPWTLLQEGQALWLRPEKQGSAGVVLADSWANGHVGDTIWIEGQGKGRLKELADTGVCVRDPDAPLAQTHLALGGCRATVQPIARPTWAHRFGETDKGVVCQIELPWRAMVDLKPEEPEQRYALPNGHFMGVDSHGLYLELVIKQKKREHFYNEQVHYANFRLRYLPPGTFLMGSPEGEGDADGDADEHPQHPVTLTKGFWLAETPCTQALWQAVMGDNPSHFTEGEDAPRRPVENVSHKSVIRFLHALSKLLPPGVEAVLPSEAQWEYACRAGTQTVYWWGDAVDPAHANMDYTEEKSWDDKAGTSPVDRYPPNPWGLYDMHGNVWEWCADDKRIYEAKAEVNPLGNGTGVAFAVRGGSWFLPPGRARAAYRGVGHAGSRARYLGFRFALRSSSLGPEGSA